MDIYSLKTNTPFLAFVFAIVSLILTFLITYLRNSEEKEGHKRYLENLPWALFISLALVIVVYFIPINQRRMTEPFEEPSVNTA